MHLNEFSPGKWFKVSELRAELSLQKILEVVFKKISKTTETSIQWDFR